MKSEYPFSISAESAALRNIELETLRCAIDELNDFDKQLIIELFFLL